MGGGGVRYEVARCETKAVGWAMTCINVEEKRVDVMMGRRGEGACTCRIKRDPVGLYVRTSQQKIDGVQRTFPSIHLGHQGGEEFL